MVLWMVSFYCSFLSIYQLIMEKNLLKELILRAMGLFSYKVAFADLQKIQAHLLALKDQLQSGFVLTEVHWRKTRSLAAPWGSILSQVLTLLVSQGMSLTPTLVRFESLCLAHVELLGLSRSAASQALLQAIICGCLPGVLGLSLLWVLPELASQWQQWLLACLLATCLCLGAGLWIIRVARNARWLGLRHAQQSWLILIFCALEFLVALLRAGLPVDVAWKRVFQLLETADVKFAHFWGENLVSQTQAYTLKKEGVLQLMFEQLMRLKTSLTHALQEGQGAAPRIEYAIYFLRSLLDQRMRQSCQSVATRALAPLFLLVAPGILGLLGLALLFCMPESIL
jgi:hypothetical protein